MFLELACVQSSQLIDQAIYFSHSGSQPYVAWSISKLQTVIGSGTEVTYHDHTDGVVDDVIKECD